jgi:hypothetical protein
VFAVAVAIGSLASAPSPSAGATPADARATGAYLRASYAFDRAAVASLASAEVDVAEYLKRVSGECPGVLANAPSLVLEGAQPSPAQVRQLDHERVLVDEVFAATFAAWLSPDRAPFQPFARAVGRLRWRDARIARLVRAELLNFERYFATTPDVCADMRAWASTGYQTLPAGARATQTLFLERAEGSGPSLETSIARLEDGAQKALARRRKHVIERLDAQTGHLVAGIDGLLRSLGVKLPSPIPEAGEEPTGGDVIGRGMTAAGTTYRIAVTGPNQACPMGLTLSETSNGNLTVTEPCLSRSRRRPQQLAIGCNEGDVTILMQLPAGVEIVELKLAGGRKLASRALPVPAKDGGPLALYYQALPHAARTPLALIELGAHGRRVGTVQVRNAPHCRLPRPGESTSSGSLGVANGG